MPLIVTSSGGAGHLQVAAVLEEAEKKKSVGDKKCKLVVKDVMKDFVGERVGDYAVNQWNDAQKAGDIGRQNKLIKRQPLADRLFYLPIFFQALMTMLMMKTPPKKIINTQVIGCRAILHALKIFNLFKRTFHSKWVDVKMELWMTDFVSKKATHFLVPLRTLRQWEKNMMDVYIPNSPERKKDFAYFISATKSSNGACFRPANVHSLEESQLPVKEIYKSDELKIYAPDTQRAVNFDLSWGEKTCGAAQVATLKTLPNISRGLAEDGKRYQVPSGDLVYTLMLGSQPTAEVVKRFVKKIIEISNENKSRHLHFFAFCGKDEEGKASLFKEICQLVKNEAGHTPENLTIVPLPFQKQENIAKMLARSKRRFTRAGGVTSFQHLAMRDTLSKNGSLDAGKVCIVAEVNAQEFLKNGKNKIYDAIPGWEGRNAKYLVKTMGASVVSLDKIEDEMRSGLNDR